VCSIICNVDNLVCVQAIIIVIKYPYIVLAVCPIEKLRLIFLHSSVSVSSEMSSGRCIVSVASPVGFKILSCE
jgi:hypothetical protein